MNVDCAQVEDFFASADVAARRDPPERIREHLHGCAPCRAVWEFMTAEEATAVEEALCSKISGRLQGSAPVKPLPCRTRLTAAFLGIFLAGAGLWVLDSGWAADSMTSLQLTGTLAAVAAAAALAAVVLSREMAPGDKRVGPVGWMTLLAIGGLGLVVAVLFPWERSGSSWLSAAMQCHTHGAMIAIPTAAAAFLIFRRGAALRPGAAGAAIGLLAGLAAMATLHLACAMHTALHITAGHLSIPAGAALIGYGIGKLVERFSLGGRSRSLEA